MPRSGVSVVVRFKATGNAPIMKQNFYKITAGNQFQAVIAFLRRELGWKQSDALVSRQPSRPVALVRAKLTPARPLAQFVYINASFSPAPDDTVANLYKVSSSPLRLRPRSC